MSEPEPARASRSRDFALAAVTFEGMLAIAAIGIGWLIGFSPLTRLTIDADNWTLHLRAAGWGLAASVPMFAGLALLERIHWQPVEQIRQIVNGIIIPLMRDCSLLDLAVISLMAGVGEEVLFRGLVQDGIAQWLGEPTGAWIALAAASLAFGLAHAITRLYIVLATLIGLYLGLVYWWADSLVAPIVAHAAYDFGALAYFVRQGNAQKAENA
jgi:membrane protease YdiL (CAAX protease family)